MHWASWFTLAAIGPVIGYCHPQDSSDSVTSRSMTAQSLLARGIEALGGLEKLSQVTSLTYVGGDIYRTKSMLETFSLIGVDKSISTAGVQNVSFSYNGLSIQQRIDRSHQLGEYWTFARPTLQPINFSLLVHGGDDGFAAVVNGSFSLFAPGAPPSGYVDGLLAAYLIREAHRMSPLLLLEMMSNNKSTMHQEKIDAHVSLPAGMNSIVVLDLFHDAVLNLTAIFDPRTGLPYIVRSHERHEILGQSTKDLVLTGYTSVNGLQFPTRFKSIYNGYKVFADYTVSEVLVNVPVDMDFENDRDRQSEHAPARKPGYEFAEIGELYESHVWGGEYRGTLPNLTAINPYPELPGMVYEFEDFVVVLDCPPHQSHLVIQWVKEKLKKPLKYVWPSHHHHDHALGVRDYVQAGAKVIALDFARDYYSTVPLNKFVTYSTKKPFIFRDKTMQVAFVHMEQSVHAADYAYAYASPACPTANSTTVIFDADDVSPAGLTLTDHSVLLAALSELARDGVSKKSIFYPAHSDGLPFKDIIDAAGYYYPNHTALDFKFLRSSC
ncbi:hypothetical protein FOPG_17141 [Fusarium oxysporum f. sp. conglutinans race 2 54008]|uniref:Metallo-beta-lactamase domain-containing protein n=1 Tax=Fusarium oxysporum f. sp. conglutinans race 2 54008 TaxID=1089457 RepID=X0I041_FUSOX|nr:hypothetical protein FOPG_17141 [Fusarium oxysporum f. sp. conglutinans race 2 54008]